MIRRLPSGKTTVKSATPELAAGSVSAEKEVAESEMLVGDALPKYTVPVVMSGAGCGVNISV